MDTEDRSRTTPRPAIRSAAAVWGVAGVLLLLVSAIVRLVPIALGTFDHALDAGHWAALVGVVVAMAYLEGHRGFARAFSPRVAARARWLAAHPSTVRVVLAPLFCMGYFHATRRRQITSITLTLAIVALVVAVRLVAQPWRGIVDAGVVVGLAWGTVALLVFVARAFTAERFDHPPEVPETDERAGDKS